MSSSVPGFADLLRSFIREARRRVLTLAILFTVVAHVALAVGLLQSKKWECSALLVPDSATILRPLVEGRAAGGPENQLATVVQLMQTRKILRELLAHGGWTRAKMLPQEEEVLLAQLRSRIRLEPARESMIRISYRDTDPKRALLITNKIAEIMIREASDAREKSSREAYEFIEKQVKEYGAELPVAHEKLLAYYRSQEVTVPEAPTGASPQPPTPRRAAAAGNRPPRLSADDIAELRAEQATLTAQLARHRPATAAPEAPPRQAEDQLRARVDQLRFDHERLAASYTEQHPDVVRKAHDLAAAREELKHLERARIESEKARTAMATLDDQVATAARARLEQVRTLLEGTQAPPASPRLPRQPAPTRASLPAQAETVDPEIRRVGQDSRLSELLRRYEATRDVYQDLLKRRETARLALDLDVERRGATLRVQEAAEMPVIATGLRVMHKSAIGLALALVLPLGLLLAKVRFDGRLRSALDIERLARVPLLVSIPYSPSARDRRRSRLHRGLALALVVSVFAVYVAVYFVTKAKAPR